MKIKTLINKLKKIGINVKKYTNANENICISDPMSIPDEETEGKETLRYIFFREEEGNYKCIVPSIFEVPNVSPEEDVFTNVVLEFVNKFRHKKVELSDVYYHMCGKSCTFRSFLSVKYLLQNFCSFTIDLMINGKNYNYSCEYEYETNNYIFYQLHPYRSKPLEEFTKEDILFLRQYDIPLGIKADYIMDKLK